MGVFECWLLTTGIFNLYDKLHPSKTRTTHRGAPRQPPNPTPNKDSANHHHWRTAFLQLSRECETDSGWTHGG